MSIALRRFPSRDPVKSTTELDSTEAYKLAMAAASFALSILPDAIAVLLPVDFLPTESGVIVLRMGGTNGAGVLVGAV